jgi:hypothetical protein
MHIAASLLLVLSAAIAVRGLCVNPSTIPELNVTAYMVSCCTRHSLMSSKGVWYQIGEDSFVEDTTERNDTCPTATCAYNTVNWKVAN